MGGPQLVVGKQSTWMQRLRERRAIRWYCVHPAVAPRGFSNLREDGKPGEGDVITLREDVYQDLVRYLNGARDWEARDAHRLAFHEWLHCCEFDDAMVEARLCTREELIASEQAYGHPDSPLPAILHAIRCGFACNSFTGVLRWRLAPRNQLPAFHQWVQERRGIRPE